MDRGFWPLAWITTAFIVSYAFCVFPEGEYARKWVILHDWNLSFYDYAYYFGERVRWIIYSFVGLFYIQKVVPKIKVHLQIFAHLTVFYLADFILFANEPIAKVSNAGIILNGHIFGTGWTDSMQKCPGIGVSAALIIGFSMIFVTFSTLLHGRNTD